MGEKWVRENPLCQNDIRRRKANSVRTCLLGKKLRQNDAAAFQECGRVYHISRKFNLFPSLTVAENIYMGMNFSQIRKAKFMIRRSI